MVNATDCKPVLLATISSSLILTSVLQQVPANSVNYCAHHCKRLGPES